MSLAPQARADLKEHVLRAYLGNRSDGARTFAAIAFACTGTKP